MIGLTKTWQKAALCVLSGTLYFLACASFDIWPLAWFAGVPLLWVTQHVSTKKPWVWGLLGGFVANAGGFYWLVGFMGRFGHLPIFASIPIFALMVTYQGITFAIWAHVTRRLTDRLALPVTLVAPLVWVAAELCVPYVFPWYLAITQAWVPPAIQIAELTGPLGVSFLLVLSSAALYELATVRAVRRAAIAFSIIAATVVFGFVRIHEVQARRAAAPKLKVGVVQANIGIHEKWRPELGETQLETHQKLSAQLEQRGANLIVWPESSYPYFFVRDQTQDWPLDTERHVQRGFHTPVLFGSLTLSRTTKYPYNTALLLDANGQLRGSFDKTILMVFGEYIPFYEQLRFIKDLIPATSNFARGTEVATFPVQWTRDGQKHDAKVAPMICYEDIFPSFGRRIAKLGPNLLINITNDAWFGNTSEPWEHMALSVYRAIELRTDLVRAVNTGVSAFIDATGKVYAKTHAVDPDEGEQAPMTLLEDVAILQPSTLYATLGEWFGSACLLIVVALSLRASSKAGTPLRLGPLLVGAGALLGILVFGLLVTGGGQRVQVGLRLLAHMTSDASADDAFATGTVLFVLGIIGSVVAGIVTTRRGGARQDVVVAILLVVALPALVLGTLEGEQAGLVVGGLVAVGLGLLGARFSRRRD
ncbi:MAG: apolipoprotein N-acyltransferase [Polyangia bacterium]